MKYTCRGCGLPYEAWRSQCVKCRLFNSIRASIESLVISSTDETEVFARETWTTGEPIFDQAFGGGIVKNTSTLIGGIAGVGKSTIVMQACGKLAQLGKKVLYVAGEEHPSQVIARAKNVGARHPNLNIIGGSADWSDIERAAKMHDVGVYDSIQRLGVHAEACQFPATRILISQLNGDGGIAAGRDNEHDPDILAICHLDGDDLFVGEDKKVRQGRIDVVKHRWASPNTVRYLLSTVAVPRRAGDIEDLRSVNGYEEEEDDDDGT